MAQEQFKVLTPAPDGVITAFTVGIAYQPGSTVLYANGINQLHRLGDPWTEFDPGTGAIVTAFVPEPGDELFLRFVDTTADPIATEITEIEGTIEAVDGFSGELVVVLDLDGTIGAVEDLDGEISALADLDGEIDGVEDLEGEAIVIEDAGLSLEAHRTARHLIHFIDSGPGGGFASLAYKEVIGGLFPTLITWYTNPDKLLKIVETEIERSIGGATKIKPTPVKWRMYDEAGVLLVEVTDTITYTGITEATRTRTIVEF